MITVISIITGRTTELPADRYQEITQRGRTITFYHYDAPWGTLDVGVRPEEFDLWLESVKEIQLT